MFYYLIYGYHINWNSLWRSLVLLFIVFQFGPCCLEIRKPNYSYSFILIRNFLFKYTKEQIKKNINCNSLQEKYILLECGFFFF